MYSVFPLKAFDSFPGRPDSHMTPNFIALYYDNVHFLCVCVCVNESTINQSINSRTFNQFFMVKDVNERDLFNQRFMLALHLINSLSSLIILSLF